MKRRDLVRGVKLLALGCAMLASLTAAMAQSATHLAQSPLSVGAIVQNIVAYTAWPGARRDLVVCATRNGVDANDVQRQYERAPDGRVSFVKRIDANSPLPADCDVIFFEGWSPESQRTALRSLAQKAVLTVGREPGFCSDGGLFCLDPQPGGIRFEVNLDAVARSGLRVHPQVLRLAHPQSGSQS